MNWNFQEILTKDPSSAGGCDTSGNISPCGLALRRTCRCTEFHRVKNANLCHPSAMCSVLVCWGSVKFFSVSRKTVCRWIMIRCCGLSHKIQFLLHRKHSLTPLESQLSVVWGSNGCLFYGLYGTVNILCGKNHTQRRTTVGRTPLDEWSARRRDLYLTTHNTQRDKHPCHRRDWNPQS